MRRAVFGLVVLLCGLAMVLSGISSLIVPEPATAQSIPRPSPRPTLRPDGDRTKPTPQPVGPVLGTVIDLTTGAPAPGITVAVNFSTLVVTDQNGNYGIWVAPGTYTVELRLQPAQGVPEQGPLTIEVPEGSGQIVQHLFFRSPLATTPTLVPTEVPTAAAEPPPPVVAVEPPPVDVPLALPRTGTERSGSAGLLIFSGLMLMVTGGLIGRQWR